MHYINLHLHYITLQLREAVENRKVMKAIERVGKVEFDHHVISRHTLQKHT